MNKKIIFFVIGVAVALALLIQLVPYGRNHSNPPVMQEPNWDSQTTRDLAKRACFDCHSNETVWPWYSNIAPVSWLVQRDTMEGRSKLNFSEWVNGSEQLRETDEIYEVIQEGEMPPPFYLPLHPEANLTEAEKQTLIKGLQNTLQ
ncbi:MAG: cytochrome C [Anaerolineaceae bacterium]|nr:cytochrome C [Anaerolineaceae bacterium]